VTRELVILAYRLILGRDPESEAAIESHRRLGNVETLRRTLLGSREFATKHYDFPSRLPCIHNFQTDWVASSKNFYNNIQNSGISLDRVSDMYASAGLSGKDYTVYHLCRFHELFAFLVSQVGASTNRMQLLEVGTSAHTTPFYRNFIKSELDTICRPAADGGPSQQWAATAGSRHHWEIDINEFERYAQSLNEVPSAYYDIVVCCEVIEHLMRPPRDLINFALSKMKNEGFLFLTTPNFLTPHKIQKLLGGNNPTSTFLDYHDNIHAHHHFREYTVGELVEEVAHAGGTVESVVLSHCWDYPTYIGDDETMFRSNITLIVTRRAAVHCDTGGRDRKSILCTE
jgi:hypothetical protein